MKRQPDGATSNPLAQLSALGQSVWLDYIRRSLITSGELDRLVREDSLGGLTSNPAIFEKAIGGSSDYAAALDQIAQKPDLQAKRVFELLAIADIQDAADALRPVYDRTEARDGYVSLEVAPDLAKSTEGTLDEARRLWSEVDRPNLMIKVPATPEGVPAIRTLLAEGINVNVTLLFARAAYETVARAYLEALETRAKAGKRLDRVASVASFFVSRIDTAADALLAEKSKGADGPTQKKLEALMGKVAIANAKLAYQSYKELFSGGRWQTLKSLSANPQRVLWASTGTKNPNYSDVLYVEELIGPETVNTMPPETLAAFRDHGRAEPTLEAGIAEAEEVLRQLESVGISLRSITDELLADGLKKFVEPFTKLLGVVEHRYRDAKKAAV